MVLYKYLTGDLSNDTVKEKVKLFSRLVYKLSRPNPDPKDVTTHRWPTYKHPTLALGAMAYDPNYIIPFRLKSPDGTFNAKAIAIIEEIVALWYPNATVAKKAAIRSFVKNNEGATVEQMLPNTLEDGIEIKTQAEIEADDWFATNE